MNRQVVVATILLAHFIAAFAALGMPPFFPIILNESLHSDAQYLAGWLYSVPTLFMAISSPWWGRLADRYGKRLLLMRAQLGLAASFLLAGFAENEIVFFIALAMQGLLGGTFAASNAYLATFLQGSVLSRCLTLMQGSARAALIIAPIVIGLFIEISSPIKLYSYLAILPLLASILIYQLPETVSPQARSDVEQRSNILKQSQVLAHIYLLQFIFVLSTVSTFPYFIVFAQATIDGLSASHAGVLFGLPHLVYLIAAGLVSQFLTGVRLQILLLAFVGLCVSFIGQAYADSFWLLTAWRIVMGMCMCLGFICLHNLIAAVVRADNAGKAFGWIESGSKWGAVVAGLVAGILAHKLNLQAPLLFAAGSIGMAVIYIIFLHRYRHKVLLSF